MQSEQPAPVNLTSEALANRQYICEQICRSFNLDELRSICFALDVGFHTLPGQTCRPKVMALIDELDHRGDLQDLIAECRFLRPNDAWTAPI